MEPKDGKLHLTVNNGSNFNDVGISNQSSWTAGNWYYVVGTYSGTTGNVYVNGLQEGVSNTSIRGTTNSTEFHIGGDSGYDFKPFLGVEFPFD